MKELREGNLEVQWFLNSRDRDLHIDKLDSRDYRSEGRDYRSEGRDYRSEGRELIAKYNKKVVLGDENKLDNIGNWVFLVSCVLIIGYVFQGFILKKLLKSVSNKDSGRSVHFGSPGVKSKPLESAIRVKSPANYNAKMKSLNLEAVKRLEKIYFEACGYSMDRKKEFVRMFNKGLDNGLGFEDKRVNSSLGFTDHENLLRFILAFLELVDEKDMEDSHKMKISKYRTRISDKVWERDSD